VAKVGPDRHFGATARQLKDGAGAFSAGGVELGNGPVPVWEAKPRIGSRRKRRIEEAEEPVGYFREEIQVIDPSIRAETRGRGSPSVAADRHEARTCQ